MDSEKILQEWADVLQLAWSLRISNRRNRTTEHNYLGLMTCRRRHSSYTVYDLLFTTLFRNIGLADAASRAEMQKYDGCISSVRPTLGSVLAAMKSPFRFRPSRRCIATLPLSSLVRSGNDYKVCEILKRSTFNMGAVPSKR